MTEKPKPGEVYEAGEPVFLGRIPVRSEVTVLPADEPKDKPLGWKCDIREGCEIYRSLETQEMITTRDGLKPGDVVYAMSLVGGYYETTIYQKDDGELQGKSGEHTLVFLRFLDDPEVDDRAPVWITWGAANTRGLRKLELTGS